MDADRFDRIVASLTRPGTRRGALQTLTGAILGAAGLGALLGSEAAGKEKGKGKQKRRGRDGNRRKQGKIARAQALPSSCCSSGDCSPGEGKYLTKCCFDDASLTGANFKRANVSSASFHGANLTNADFSKANLQKACLVDADITGAKLSGANLNGAVFCRTRTGASTYNNSGCGKASKCCQTCVPVDETGCTRGGACCGGAECTGGGEGTCTCPAGLTNCNGVCVDLLTDMNNCAQCGNVCPTSLPNADVFCGEGVDENNEPAYGCVFLCGRDFRDCNDDPDDGCEVEIRDNNFHCGTCANTDCAATGKECKGCTCLPPGGTSSICQEVTNAKVIRRR